MRLLKFVSIGILIFLSVTLLGSEVNALDYALTLSFEGSLERAVAFGEKVVLSSSQDSAVDGKYSLKVEVGKRCGTVVRSTSAKTPR